jgi:hypothetical protein
MTKRLQLTIYVDASEMRDEMPLYEFIVLRLLHQHVAGATAIRGVMGFGHHQQLHRKRLFGVSDDPPIMIVAVDEADRIHSVLPEIRALIPESTITLHEVEVL